ncbi:MAG: SDR family oxidoreductase [Proteobacteria bacterium]|nr:SDR family oxidoreductase [Pseudomonadota bacterium]
MKKLTHKKALITGGSSGLGQEIAIALATEGAKVVFGYYHNEEGAQKTLEEIEKTGGIGFSIKANLEDPTQNLFLIQETYKILKGIDILINNAGIIIPHLNFTDISLESLQKTQSINLISPFILIQETAKIMKKKNKGGSIINISSMSTQFITPGSTHYECSKAAIDALTKGAAYDLAPYGIRVNGIAPASIATSINERQRLKDPKGWIKRKNTFPLKEGFPEDIANACIFLSSQASKWITGLTLPIDGGARLINPFNLISSL